MKWDDYYFPTEMLQQADVIEKCLDDLEIEIEDIAKKLVNINSIHVVGSGDCYFIGPAAISAFEENAGIDTKSYEAYDYYLRKPKVDDSTLVILFSSSGKSLYVIKSLEFAGENNAITLGITNHENSELGENSNISLITEAMGISKSYPTKTTTVSLSLMFLLSLKLGIYRGYLNKNKYDALLEELKVTVPLIIRKIFSNEISIIRKNAQKFLESRSYLFVGSGAMRSAAMIGAAKIIETNRCQGFAMNAEEYMHLFGFSVKSPDTVIVLANNLSVHRETQVIEYAEMQCARILVVGDIVYKETDNIIKISPYLSSLSSINVVIPTMVIMHIFGSELSRLSDKNPDAPHDVDLRHVIDLLYTGPVAGWQIDK